MALCHSRLKNRGDVVNCSISEMFFRDSQVLPNRTHPTMSMDASGGYILYGTKVLDVPRPRPATAAGAATVVAVPKSAAEAVAAEAKADGDGADGDADSNKRKREA